MFRRPLSPKFHGAWLGAGTGAWLGTAIIALIQNYITHHALPVEVQSLIMGLFSPVGAAVGSWLQPLAGNGQVLVDSSFSRAPERVEAAYTTVRDVQAQMATPPVRTRRGAAEAGLENPPAS